jgi:uncharacterized iron-regulated membrane protein
MPQVLRFSLRRLWMTFHRWIGLTLLVLLVPISVSGALLVYHDEFDALVNPARWAVSGPELALSPTQYMAAAATVVAANEIVTGIRFPSSPGRPVVVLARQQAAPASGRPRSFSIFIDPPTGKVLDKVDFRSSWVGFMHVFHGNLLVPQYSGRQIVGWVGVGMLILSLTGIWLWWPRRGSLLSALRWRRGPYTSTNLHQLLGFWISIPLAIVSLTGIYLSFPQQARSLMSSVAPMQPQQRPNFAVSVVDKPQLTADQALRLARTVDPAAQPAALFLPTEANRRPMENREGGAKGEGGKERDKAREGGKGRDGAANGRDAAGREAPSPSSSPSWRVQLRDSAHELITVTIDDRNSSVRRQPDPLAGNRAAQWIRWIHDGARGGPVWQFIVFLTGVFPVVFAFTGLLMWWRGWRMRRKVRAGDARPAGQEQLVAAE